MPVSLQRDGGRTTDEVVFSLRIRPPRKKSRRVVRFNDNHVICAIFTTT